MIKGLRTITYHVTDLAVGDVAKQSNYCQLVIGRISRQYLCEGLE